MNDEFKIFALYQEAVGEQPQMIQWANGTKEWWLHDKLHREGAPAIEWADGGKEWWLHDKLHREDGAAIERANGSKEWWLRGRRFNDAEAWAERVLQMQNKSCDAASVDAFLKQILKKNIAL